LSARKFKVKVNGKIFDVEVEEMDGELNASVVASKPGMTNSTKSHPANFSSSMNGRVAAPIPGKVLGVNVNKGDAVTRGEVLLVLESMKIENPILAPCDGRVEEINVVAGAQVRTGDPLVVIV